MSVTAGPAKLLLDAFCALAAGWLADERDAVDCALHPGRFDLDGLRQYRLRPPSVRATCMGVVSARQSGGGVELDLRLAAAVISDEGALEAHGDRASRLATRLAFELSRPQSLPDSRGVLRDAWPLAAFGERALDGDDSRACDIGDPVELRAANLYSGASDKRKVSIWAVTWVQAIRARPGDFDLPLPAPAGLPDTVLAGTAPEIGPGREGDYETVVPEDAS